jgi:hypothetical protein
MFDTIFGLPTHALVVHGVVVLLPLAAAGAVAVALVPPLRRRFGLLVAALAVVSVGSVPVATRSGQHLFDRKSALFGPNDTVEAGLMEQHRTLGQQLLPWAVLLGVATLVVVGVPLLFARRARVGSHRTAAGGLGVRPTTAMPLWARVVSWVGIAGVLVGAVASTILVVRIGHAGSKAVWDKVISPSTTAPR